MTLEKAQVIVNEDGFGWTVTETLELDRNHMIFNCDWHGVKYFMVYDMIVNDIISINTGSITKVNQ